MYPLILFLNYLVDSYIPLPGLKYPSTRVFSSGH